MSTFQGLELARKALFAQQGALYTTGHNISNVNTEGYSRQRVNFETTTPFPVPSRVQPQIAGQLGTGVEIGAVQRIRNQFLDFQFRAENSRFGHWQTKQEALSRMEELLNEPSENGLSKTMDRFWDSLQILADHPDDSGARSVVAERGLALAETFNHLSRSLQSIQADLKEQIHGSVDDINSLLRQINDLNQQIQRIEPHGYIANDLYDERDRLIDRLSDQLNIKVHYTKSSDSAKEIAEGIASIELLDEKGNSFGASEADKIYLIDAKNANSLSEAINYLSVEPSKEESGPITNIIIGDEDGLGLELMNSTGSLSALIEAYGYESEDGEEGIYPEMLKNLDKMAEAFAHAFNEVHRAGFDLTEVPDDDGEISASGRDFFVNQDANSENENTSITAANITVNSEILDDSDYIAAGVPGQGSRNGNNAHNLADVLDNPLRSSENEDEEIPHLDNRSPRGFYTELIGEMGVQGQEAGRMKDNTEILRDQVNHSRMSVSAVSLDEEISNLIKFQHAYNAAARNMTAIDELIDRIINHMGLVGR